MSAVSPHGRRRAESTRPRSTPIRAASSFGPLKRLAVVTLAGAILTGAGLAHAASPGTTELATASHVNPIALPDTISAPADAAIKFPGDALSSGQVSSAATAPVTSEANAVTPLAAPAPAPAPVAPVVVDDPAAAKAYAATQVAAHGWGAGEMSCLTQLWERESSWLTSAENPSSGAYGIAQSLPANKMDSVGGDWQSNFQTQIKWGLIYIEGRYGTPCGAWGHSNAVGWY